MSAIDFREVRREIKEAARRAFSTVRASVADEFFYAFALYSDSDGSTVCPAANSRESCQRCLDRQERSRQETEKLLAASGISYSDYMNHYRWHTAEWEYCHQGADEFHHVYNLINVEDRYDDEPYMLGDDEYDAENPGGLDGFKAKVFGSMALALSDLDAEGFFGIGAERQSITLLCGVTGSDDTFWLENESARVLNPPAVFQAFNLQWTACLADESRGLVERPTRSSVYRPFLAHLRSERLLA